MHIFTARVTAQCNHQEHHWNIHVPTLIDYVSLYNLNVVSATSCLSMRIYLTSEISSDSMKSHSQYCLRLSELQQVKYYLHRCVWYDLRAVNGVFFHPAKRS